MFDTQRALLDRFLASRRRSAKEAALQLDLLAEFASADRDARDPVGEFTHLEIAAIAHVTERFARNWLALAQSATTRLPQTMAALRAGDIDLYQVRRIAEATSVLPAELAAEVEAVLVPQLAQWNPRQLNYYLRKAVARADPAAANARAAAQEEARRVTHIGCDDGAGLLQIQGNVERTQLAHDQVRAIARQLRTSGDSRTLDQIASDVALDCLAGKDFQHAKVHVWLTLPAATALRVDDKPAYLAGYGWLPAQRALELAAQEDATWQRVLTEPTTGHVLDVGRHKYRPPAALRDHMQAGYRTCTGPGCRRPAHECDGDHVVPFPQGATDQENVRPACRPHHRAKTHGGWRVTNSVNGGLVWITKHGFSFRHEPEPIADPEPSQGPRQPPTPLELDQRDERGRQASTNENSRGRRGADRLTHAQPNHPTNRTATSTTQHQPNQQAAGQLKHGFKRRLDTAQALLRHRFRQRSKSDDRT